MNPRQVKAVKRFAPYNVHVRSQLSTFSEKDQKAWKTWLQEYTRDSNHPDLHENIPSSQIPPPESHVKPAKVQLFAIIDTCSLVRFRAPFMKFITDLRRSYHEQDCPVKFLMPLVVLEELDKCNRPIKKAKDKQNHQQANIVKSEHLTKPLDDVQHGRELPIADLLQQDAPPRAFMRFIDVEMRAGLIVGDLDPYRTQKLPPMEILTHDDRILECSIRAQMFVKAHSGHPDTRVVLVTEDNNFKSKATTFGVASFRWREFEAKYHNFGRRHCVSTPLVKRLDTLTLKENQHQANGTNTGLRYNIDNMDDQGDRLKKEQSDAISSPKQTIFPSDKNSFTSNVTGDMQTDQRVRQVTSDCDGGLGAHLKRSTALKIKTKLMPLKTEEEVEIIREPHSTARIIMGAGQSGGVEIGGSSMGYQVLRLYPDSPGSRAGLRAYFDFIVAIGQTRFNKEDGSLREILKASVDQKVKMFVYNIRTKQVREVDIVPTTSWGGSGLLGVSIKHSSFDKADERVWHVIEVDPGSPAQQAGFKAGNDYVIGSDSILQENDDLYNLIEAHEGKALKLFVYNVETDNCREVICHPNSKWGGRGFLGCEFGHGLLHRMPYNEIASGEDSKKSSLPSSIQVQNVLNQQANNGTSAPQAVNLLQQQAAILNQTSTQPGQQLFQQALFNSQSPKQQQPQSVDLSKPVEKSSLPPPPQAPQTFAQLASAQFQTQQFQQQTAQIQQQQQLLEQQRQQLEEQKRQMEQLSAANQPPSTASPGPAGSVSPSSSQSYASEQTPQSQNNQLGPPLPPPPQQSQPILQQHQQQLHQYTPPSQQSPPPQKISPPPMAPLPTQSSTQLPPPPLPPQQQQQQQQQQPPSQVHHQQFMPQSSPYQQYPYGGGLQTQFPEMSSAYGPPSDSSQSSLPPSIQTLPPPPMMYPQPPQSQQQHSQSQPPPPPPPQFPSQHQQPPPNMFANQM